MFCRRYLQPHQKEGCHHNLPTDKAVCGTMLWTVGVNGKVLQR